MGICQRASTLLALLLAAGPVLGVGIVVDNEQVIVGGISCGAGEALAGFQTDGTPVCACLSGLTQCAETCVDLMGNPAGLPGDPGIR